MPQDRAGRQATVTCPICGRPLHAMADGWLDALECERCGKFSDFGSASLSHVKHRRSLALQTDFGAKRKD